ncbi:hypothetical protein PoB_004208200 [Plakobranchus ocellatus]|uniref:Uncharacterized protein n=1 Tax=Plakobranchus ocellatus TaxID=259542 RepID=A0AAV4B7W0_9GAST|nr:hypothetical protein PoB_004208200 [Plakobranchus ocellatus]
MPRCGRVTMRLCQGVGASLQGDAKVWARHYKVMPSASDHPADHVVPMPGLLLPFLPSGRRSRKVYLSTSPSLFLTYGHRGFQRYYSSFNIIVRKRKDARADGDDDDDDVDKDNDDK